MKRRNQKRGSNLNGTTSPSDVAALAAKIRRDAAKKRHKRGSSK